MALTWKRAWEPALNRAWNLTTDRRPARACRSADRQGTMIHRLVAAGRAGRTAALNGPPERGQRRVNKSAWAFQAVRGAQQSNAAEPRSRSTCSARCGCLDEAAPSRFRPRARCARYSHTWRWRRSPSPEARCANCCGTSPTIRAANCVGA